MRLIKSPSADYTAPFAAFIVLLGLSGWLPGHPLLAYWVRSMIVLAVLLLFSRRVISFRTSNPAGSIALGVAVFFVWIGPDLLWPGYRAHWLFANWLTSLERNAVPPGAGSDPLFLSFRVAGHVALVPVIEELFWRAWLMRWLVAREFWRLPLGHFSAYSFWICAGLFASEHGSYWDVGFLAGVAYNWWIVRTRSLGDCILAHAVTNGCLAAYVVGAGQWQYWA